MASKIKISMGKFILTYKSFGENALLIEWPFRIEEDILYDIINFQKNLELRLPDLIEEFIPAYQSLTLFFNPQVISHNDLIVEVKQLYQNADHQHYYQPKVWHIPVCYNTHFALDLYEISERTNLKIDQVIELHTSTLYTVYFIGFLPGFLYLGGLLPQLHMLRKFSPVKKVLKGAVAIGGSQTGVYPQESAGGWNIIGNSPINLLDINKNPPVFASAGDKVKFFAIDLMEHEKLLRDSGLGLYQLKVDYCKNE
jgi:inhibitor of KinA